MYGSRLAITARHPPPPAPADNNENYRTRDPVTSPPLPVPDRIARGQLSPKSWPQLFWGQRFAGKPLVSRGFSRSPEYANRRFGTERYGNRTHRHGENPGNLFGGRSALLRAPRSPRARHHALRILRPVLGNWRGATAALPGPRRSAVGRLQKIRVYPGALKKRNPAGQGGVAYSVPDFQSGLITAGSGGRQELSTARSRNKIDAKKLAKLLRLLASDKDGEVLAAVEAIKRTLDLADLDFHDLADVVTAGFKKPEKQRTLAKWSPPAPDTSYWESMAWWAHYHRQYLSTDDRKWYRRESISLH
jgi:hypothetical protein